MRPNKIRESCYRHNKNENIRQVKKKACAYTKLSRVALPWNIERTEKFQPDSTECLLSFFIVLIVMQLLFWHWTLMKRNNSLFFTIYNRSTWKHAPLNLFLVPMEIAKWLLKGKLSNNT